MTIKRRFLNTLAVIGIATILMMSFAGCGNKVISSGYDWVVTGTTHLKSLAIAEGATIKAPKGYSLTMMVDGVEKPIKAGTYKGEIVLKVIKTA